MGIKIYRRSYRVRKAALRGKEVSIPAEVPIKPGGTVIAPYDSFVLYLSLGATVDETLLVRAIKINKQDMFRQ